jgi:calcineurin-like phosphoesterase family protein
MLKPLKLKSEGKNIWFTGDIHAGHDKDFVLNRYVGVTGVEDYMKNFIAMWNYQVNDSDIVFVLGDSVLNDPKGEQTLALFRVLQGTKYILYGNHNSGMKFLVGENEFIGCVTLVDGTFNLGHYAEIIIDKQPIVLCHYPVLCWNDYLHGTWMLHGHNHGRFPDSRMGKMEDVGLDRYPLMITFEGLKAVMSKREIVNFDGRDAHAGRSF